MKIITHQRIDPTLCGTPVLVEKDHCLVKLKAIEEMAADGSGLVHGGFIFGLADYAAMLAVNHPNVVLGAAEVKFLKPVRIGESIIAEATVGEAKGKKNRVEVTVKRDRDTVFSGVFICFVLDQHVLAAHP
jgi:acyl-coenzyme A thioesterase PaaI-like protein